MCSEHVFSISMYFILIKNALLSNTEMSNVLFFIERQNGIFFIEILEVVLFERNVYV